MRYSYYRQLIKEERRQRGSHYGQQARQRQLLTLTGLLLGLYIICTYNVWRHPRPIHHVWIDDVLVEVIEENWIDKARSGLLYLGLCCGALFTVLRLCAGVSPVAVVAATATTTAASAPTSPCAGETAESKLLQQPSAHKARRLRAASATFSQRDISTIAVPSWARRRTAGQTSRTPTDEAIRARQRGSAVACVSGAADRTRAFAAGRPMRSDKDLNIFLAYEAAQRQQQLQHQQQQQRLSAGDGLGLRYRGAAEENLYQSDVEAAAAASREVLSVVYEGRATQPGSRGGAIPLASSAAATAAGLTSPSIPWAELGIFHLEEALQRTREWMSEVCRRLVDDVDQCNRWFNEHQIEAYDCHHSLQEMLPAPPPAPTMAPKLTGWGGGFSGTAAVAPPAAPSLEPKLTALLREKAYCRQAQQGMQELDTALRYDQRLKLEAQLDVSGTFPSAALTRASNAELTATREYVVDRLRTFAKQRFLVSYNASGGDAEMWRSGYPCDAHLLLHVLRSSVKGLSEYVRFGYQTGTQTQDLALYVGDTGEPYFYVRFRQGSSETLLSTRQGPTSLMEAMLAFAAVIHTYYRDIFGGIRGTVDLAEVGLLKVVTEGRRPTWGAGE